MVVSSLLLLLIQGNPALQTKPFFKKSDRNTNDKGMVIILAGYFTWISPDGEGGKPARWQKIFSWRLQARRSTFAQPAVGCLSHQNSLDTLRIMFCSHFSDIEPIAHCPKTVSNIRWHLGSSQPPSYLAPPMSEWHFWTPFLWGPWVIYPFRGTVLHTFRIQILVGTPRSLSTASLSFPLPFLLDPQKPLRHFMDSPVFRLRLNGLQVSWCLPCWVSLVSRVSVRVIDYSFCPLDSSWLGGSKITHRSIPS